uniref:bacteriocin n=1 Tax=Empedobacter falsenii TaxID=343874 RepID=UPI003F4923C6
MKNISIEEMQNIQGGGFVDGVCIGIGIASTISMFTPAAPAGITALGVASGMCTGYDLFSAF